MDHLEDLGAMALLDKTSVVHVVHGLVLHGGAGWT